MIGWCQLRETWEGQQGVFLGTQSSRWVDHHTLYISVECNWRHKLEGVLIFFAWSTCLFRMLQGYPLALKMTTFLSRGEECQSSTLSLFHSPRQVYHGQVNLTSQLTSNDAGLAQDGWQCEFPGLQADQWSEQDLAGVRGRVPALATVGQLICTFFIVQGKWQEEEERT